jgi:hypothetical protein
VYVPDGHQANAKALQEGDLVFIYESGRGETEVLYDAFGNRVLRKCLVGEQAIVTVAEVADSLLKHPNWPVTKYVGGRTRWWCWHAPTRQESTNGRVSRERVNEIMGWKPGNRLRGLGKGSGVIEVSADKAEALLDAFSGSGGGLSRLKKVEGRPFEYHVKPTGGESPAHLALKNYISKYPARVLKEQGLQLVKVEFRFPTGDRADVVLMDSRGRVVGLEVELDVGDQDLPGVLQALKYRVMLELLIGCTPGEGRAVLVAHSVTQKIRKLCMEYNIEVYTVPASAVEP